MRSRFSLIVRSIVISVAAFALLLVGLREASALGQEVVVHEKAIQTEPDGDEPIVQVTELISIPYGFDAALPLVSDGSIAAVSGQGSCTSESVTITFTVTQSSSGATATGVWNGECTGQLQRWIQAPSATPSPNFEAGEAEACAFAETFGEDEPDTQEWCDPVFLAPYHNYLPHIQSP